MLILICLLIIPIKNKMSQLFGVGLDIEVKRINNQFKMQIAKRGGIGIRSLAVIFRQMDSQGRNRLDQEDFAQALATFGYSYFLLKYF